MHSRYVTFFILFSKLSHLVHIGQITNSELNSSNTALDKIALSYAACIESVLRLWAGSRGGGGAGGARGCAPPEILYKQPPETPLLIYHGCNLQEPPQG